MLEDRCVSSLNMIKGIYGDEYEKFHSEQWVNVYANECDRAVYYATTQVKHLKELDDLDEFLMEPITEEGELMTVTEAMAKNES